MRAIIYLIPIFILCLFLVPFSQAQESIPEPDDFDIYDDSSGDFLSSDFEIYLYAASMAYGEGEYELAARYYLTYLQYDRSNSTAIYNLACCYGLLDEAELASKYLLKSFEAGFMNIDLIRTDPDFDSVRESDEFREVMVEIDEFAAMYEIETESFFLPCEAYSPCHVRYPDDFDPDEPVTLVVALHANGGFAYGFSGIYDSFEDPDFVFAAIQAPYAVGPFGSMIMYSWDFWFQSDDELPVYVFRMSTEYVARSIEALREKLNADRVYLLGFNDGAAYAFRAGLAMPEVVDGIISFEGNLDTEFIDSDTLNGGSDIRAFIVHNLARENDSHEILQDYGYDVTYYPYEGEPCDETEVYGVIQDWISAG